MRRLLSLPTTGFTGLAAAAAMLAALSFAGAAQSQNINQLTADQEITVAQNQESQERINAIDDETAELEAEYKAVLQQLETLRIYNQQIEDLIAAQNAEIANINRQIDRVTTIDREMVPLMLEMVAAYEQFVANDVPFLEGERAERVERLKALMLRADASVAEKFRRVLEAYQIENEYGRTIEAYTGKVMTGGAEKTVDFLRIGRVIYLYKARDDSEMGRWNKDTGSWENLSLDNLANVRQAIAIAQQQVAPDLVVLPVSAPENVQ